jgi:hypothetical protein
MNLSKLVVITGLFVTLSFSLSAQVKIGDNPLEIATDRWLEIQRQGTNEFLIVTDSLFLGLSSNPNSSTADPLMLKLFGYGLENFIFGAGEQASNIDGNNYFLAPSINGEVLEVPMNLSLVIPDSVTADLSVTNGVDTFGTINLHALDSIFATDIAVADSISTIRTLINMSNNSDNDTITGNEYIDEINIIGDSTLEFVENILGRLGAENRITVDLSPIIEGNTFYLADGTLDEDRIVTGDNNSLNYNGIDTLGVDATFVNIDGDEVAIQQDGQDIIMINAAEDVKVRSSTLDSILALNGTNGSVSLGEYGEGNFNVSDFTTILVVDENGNVRETTADDILGAQVDSTIYNNDGVLTGDRTLDGSGANSLTFDQLTEMTINTSGNVEIASDSIIVSGEVQLDDYGQGVYQTDVFERILVVDADGNVLETTADDILAAQVDSTIYNNDGVLTGDRTLDGSGANSLTFDQLTSMTINSSGNVEITSDSTIVTGEVQIGDYGQGTYDTPVFERILVVDAAGNVLETTADDILGSQVDSTIYNNDGVLTGDRTLIGSGTNSLTFDQLTTMTVIAGDINSNATNTNSMTGTNTNIGGTTEVTINGGDVDVTGNTIDLASTAGDITINSTLSSNVEITSDSTTVVGELAFDNYGDSTYVTTDFATFLAVDDDGNVVEVTADAILGTETDSTIYNNDGVLIGERTMLMNSFGLTFQGDAADETQNVYISPDGRMAIGRNTVTAAVMAGREVKLDVNGDILAIQVHSSSDERFKKNITTVDNAIAKVQELRGVTYDFRTDEFADKNFPEYNQLGFIAQEVEAVMPQVVRTDSEGYKSVDYSKITALLNEAIKEQQDQIENLTKQLEIANSENSEFRNELADIKSMLKELAQGSNDNKLVGDE